MRYLFLTILFSIDAFANMHFEGVPNSLVQSIQKDRPGYQIKNLSPTEIDDVLKLLYQSERFEKVRAYYKGTVLVFEGTPLRKISDITVTGASHFSNSDVLEAFNATADDRYMQQKLVDGAEAIKELYGKAGYFNTIVSISPEAMNDGQVHIQIQIQENIPTQIKEINFVTENELLKESLSKILKKYTGKPLSEEAILEIENELRDKFVEDRLLSAVLKGPTFIYNENKTEVSVNYIIENPYSYVIFLDGEKEISSNDILNKIKVNSDSQFGSNPTAEIANRIKNLYEESGYPHIKVATTEKIHPKTFSRKVFFKIEEGPRTKIKEIQIRGNFSRDPKYYEKFILKHSSQLVKNRYYNQEHIKQGTDNLISELQNQGFLQSKILSVQASFSSNREQVTITVLMDEGPLTRIGKINIAGIDAFSKEQLLKVIGLTENAPLQLNAIENSIQRLTQFYKSRGYMDMRVESQSADMIKYNASHTVADVELSLYEGPQVIVGGIIVEGNTLTKDYVIIKELEFEVGDVLTPENVGYSESSLQKTGLFSQVSITQLEIGTKVSKRNIIVKVAESDPGLFNFGVGVNTEFGLTVRGYLGLSYKNLAGTGRSIKNQLEVKRVTDLEIIDHRLTVGYFEPFVFGSKTRGRINLIRARELLSRDVESNPTEDAKAVESNKIQFLLERELTRHLKFTWNLWSLSGNREFLIPSKQVTENVVIGTVGPTLELDYRNNPFVTTDGTYSKFDMEYADPSFASSKDVRFLQVTGNVNWYKPTKVLGTVWANSVSGGYLKNLSDVSGSAVPDIEIFKLGGRDTIRGFKPLEIPGELDRSGKTIRVADDSHYYLLKSELRIPVFGQFESVLFYDGGAVNVTGFDLKDEFRDSAGLGIRYVTPAGPFRLEYGYKLDRDRSKNEDEYRIHVSFGTF